MAVNKIMYYSEKLNDSQKAKPKILMYLKLPVMYFLYTKAN